MEYTTILIDLAQVRSKKVLQEVDTQYRQTIIQYAERGWKLLGMSKPGISKSAHVLIIRIPELRQTCPMENLAKVAAGAC